MVPDAGIAAKVEAIHRFIKREGSLVAKPSPSVDSWEYKGVRSSMTDGGYGLRISADKVNVWADLGCNMTGFYIGGESELDSLMIELGIELQ